MASHSSSGIFQANSGIAARDEILVFRFGEPRPEAWKGRVHVVDDRGPRLRDFQRFPDHLRIFGVGDEHLRLGMIEHESDVGRVEPRIDRMQDRACHRHAELGL